MAATGWVKTGVPGVRRWGKTEKIQIRISQRKPGGGYRLRERTVSARTLAAVEEAKRQFQNELATGVTTAVSGTFGALLDEWLETKRLSTSPTTYARYEIAVRHHLKPSLGGVPLDRLSVRDLDRLYGSLGRQGLTANTIMKTHLVARGALEQARKWEMVPRNVALDASPPKVAKPSISTPSPEVAQRLLALAGEDNPIMASLFFMSMTTGMRRGEVVALRWSDLDLDVGSVRVERALIVVQGGVAEKRTKTNRARVLALDAGTVAMLRSHRTAADNAAAAAGGVLAEGAYVFSRRPGGTEPYRPDTVTWWFSRLCKAAKVNGFSWKDCTRHLSATQLVGAGVDVRTVAGRLGHARTSTTLDIYSGFLPEKERDAADLIGAILKTE